MTTARWSTSPPGTSRASRATRSSPRSTPRSATGATVCASTPGVEYRHLVVVPGEWAEADCVPPHDLTGKPAVWPTGPAAPHLQALMDASRPVVARGGRGRRLGRHADLAVGAGPAPAAARLRQPIRRERTAHVRRRPRARARVCSQGSRSSTCPAPPPASTTTTPPSASRASTRSATVTSSCSTSRPPTRPATSRTPARRWRPWRRGTGRSSARCSRRCRPSDPFRILLLPDHATPVELGTHTSEPVPYLLHDSESEVVGPDLQRAGDRGLPGGRRPHAHGPDGRVRLTIRL